MWACLEEWDAGGSIKHGGLLGTSQVSHLSLPPGLPSPANFSSVSCAIGPHRPQVDLINNHCCLATFSDAIRTWYDVNKKIKIASKLRYEGQAMGSEGGGGRID